MLTAVAYCVLVVLTGFAVLRALGLTKGVVALGIAPAAGLAAMAVVSSWAGLAQIPPPWPAVAILLLPVLSLVLLVSDRDATAQSVRGLLRSHRPAVGLLGLAFLVPLIAMGIAFADVHAPLSPHDGAFHVQTAHAFRLGRAEVDWYPPGLASSFGAVLQALPWLDSADGAFQLGLGLSLMGPIAVFGVSAAVVRNLVGAACAALLASLTYLFPYYPQIWGGWPQTIGIILVCGLWSLAMEHIERRGFRSATLAGLFVGAIVLTHGTEVYSAAIVLLVVAFAKWRRLAWHQLGWEIGAAIAVAAFCAAPYLSFLLHWAGSGGAFQVGFEDGLAMAVGSKSTTSSELLHVFTLDALGIDLPIRMALIAAGVAWSLRRRVGRQFAAVMLVFYGLAAIATFGNGLPVVRTLYAATFPWSLPFRLLMIVAIALALIGGVGCTGLIEIWPRFVSRLRSAGLRRRTARAARLLVVTWLVLSTWAMIVFLQVPASLLSSFSANDAAAMTWLRNNAEPGGVVVNDLFVDAAIWAPYKAGVTIMWPRSGAPHATLADRQLVLDNIGALEREPVRAAACALSLRYVYYGDRTIDWGARLFPPADVLRASPALDEVYRAGKASIFRLRSAC